MEPLSLKARKPAEDAIECWDDDEDLQGMDDLHFRNASSATFGSSRRRDSISSRMSHRSDRESGGGGDEDWQVLLPTDDEKSRADAISSAKSAGIPIPQNVPASALLGGTIKRLGGRRLKKALGDDWGEDIELPKAQDGGLKLKMNEGKEFPDMLRTFSSEFPPSPSPSKPQSTMSFMERIASATSHPGNASLDKFRDDPDDDFGDVPTIKVAKNRSPQKPMNFTPPPSKTSKGLDNFEDDLEFPVGQPLKLSTRKEPPRTPASQSNDESDFEWAEGSLGTRFGGTRRDLRSNHSSSISAFSPSASSCLTGESEDEGLDGLVLPDGNFKFDEALKKRLESISPGPADPLFDKPVDKATEKNNEAAKDDFFSGIDIGDGEVFDSGKLTLHRNIKRKANRQTSPPKRTATTLTFTNKVEPSVSKIPRPHTQDRPRSILEPVSESGPIPHYRRSGSRMGGHSATSSLSSAIPTPTIPSSNAPPSTPSRRGLNSKSSRDMLRAEPTSNPSQFLKAKRSMPLMSKTQPSPARNQQPFQRPPSRGGEYSGSRHALPARPKTPSDRSGADSSLGNTRKPNVPFLPAGTSHAQSHHISTKTTRNFNRPSSSDSNENISTNRPISRISNNLHRPTTPTRKDHAPESLVREAASKHTLTKPTRRRQFGDGNELEAFDDLPTSASTESKFVKQPVARGAPKSVQARSKLGLHHTAISVINESVPPTASTPLSPMKHDVVPRFARDTNASRLAREQRIGSVSATLHSKPSLPAIREAGGPLSSTSTNWKPPTHNTQKSHPYSSHGKKRTKAPPQKPKLIKSMGDGVNQAKTLKGMQWNPTAFCWEGNEYAIANFDNPAPTTASQGSPKSPTAVVTSKAAPALIANVGATNGVQMSNGMVFDPQQMCWLKATPANRGGTESSPDALEEEDPFAGLDDLEDGPKKAASAVTATGQDSLEVSSANLGSRAAFEDEEVLVGEEFDVGPEFVRRQRAEEERWRNKVLGWVGEGSGRDEDGGFRPGGWRYLIRAKTMLP